MSCKALSASAGIEHTETNPRELRTAVAALASTPERREPCAPANVFWHAGAVSGEARARRFGCVPLTFWLTGLSGAGKSTIAYEFENVLIHHRQPCAVLDGDNLRHRLNCDLGFSERDRHENVRRTAEVARLMNENGLVVVASLVSPYRDDREDAKTIVGADRFVEVYVSTSLDLCESRDPKGLYRKARSGEIRGFTGVSSPYEPPSAPALTVDTATLTPAAAAAMLHVYLREQSGGADRVAHG
jgi:adenylylsulfate kinase